MPNGDQHDSAGVWRAIDDLREKHSESRARTAVNESQVRELREDVNGVGKKVYDSERRVKQYVDEAVGGLNQRVDRGVTWLRWAVGLSVPLVAGLLGALISRGGS